MRPPRAHHSFRYAAAADKRSAQLEHAQELSDALFTAGELDNKYTSESMASLKSQLDVLEKLVVDKQRFVEGQIATAMVDITAEQRSELESAFHHFDKSGDGFLNMDEFTAAIKSMDFENPDQEMKDFFDKVSAQRPGSTEEAKAITRDDFVTFVATQYKDKDSYEGLLAAFKILSGGKDVVGIDALTGCLGADDTAYLVSTHLEKAGNAFMPFSAYVYGMDAATFSETLQ